MPYSKNITGQRFGHWTVLNDPGGQKALCRCDCGNERWVWKSHLRHGDSTSCGCDKYKKMHPVVDDLTGQRFGRLVVLEELGGGKIKCKCDCGTVRVFDKVSVKGGITRSCGCLKQEKIREVKNDLTGQRFNEWTVIEELGGNKVLARCSCGKVAELWKSHLIKGDTKSCGHERNLVGKQFGSWTVLEELGGGLVKCKCECGNIRNVYKETLLDGSSKSCGCKQIENRQDTLMKIYGDPSSRRTNNPRKDYQIKATKSAEEFKKYITSYDHKPTLNELVRDLDVRIGVIRKLVHNNNLEEYIDLFPTKSAGEKEMFKFLSSIYDGRIIQNIRQVIPPYELDAYLPEKHIAFEFNGNYWHSEAIHDTFYHQEKTLAAIKNNIHLIHIFEYEWEDQETKDKLKNYIKDIIGNNNTVLYARNCSIKELDSNTASDFCNKYHLQGYANASVNLGLCYNNKLIGLMTFGNPRFDTEYQYELIRLCWKSGYSIVGGAEKLFKYFISKYNPDDTVSYCDISKFTGNIYTKLGFTLESKKLTYPDHVWIKGKKILNNEQTKMSELTKYKLNAFGDTEDDIMHNIGFYKVYNCGNLKFVYNKQEGNKL